MITQFIIFTLAATGITLILVKSKLFRSMRERITGIHQDKQAWNTMNYDTIKMSDKIEKKIYWFIDSILNCSLCMGVWASGICVVFVWTHLWIVLWWLAGITIVGLLTKIYEKWMC